MADFSTLIATLQATIKTNYNQEITGQILQDDLLAIVDAVNRLKQDTLEGYAFHGAPLANGASVAVTQNTFFLVAEGEYEINGSTIEVDAAGVSVIVYDSVNDTTNWYTLFAYDTAPTENGRNAITSGAVAAALAPLATKEAVEAVEQEVAQIAGEAGLAEAVIDTDNAGAEQEFTFRKSGGDGGAYYRKIKGKTLAWNQLVHNFNSWGGANGSVSYSNNILTYTVTDVFGGAAQYAGDLGTQYAVAGHKYYICIYAMLEHAGAIYIGGDAALLSNRDFPIPAANVWTKKSYISEASSSFSGENLYFSLAGYTTGTIAVGDKMYLKMVRRIDLTQMFGAGNEPSTVAEFEALYPDAYYPYNPGTLKSNDAEAVETTGMNQWDEKWEVGKYDPETGAPSSGEFVRCKNYIKVFPNTAYYITTDTANILAYDADKNYLERGASFFKRQSFTTGANVRYLRFYCDADYGTTYNHDICINLSNPAINGQYFPYWKRTLQLDITTRKDTDGNVPFPNGLQSCPVAQDEATKEGGNIRVGTRAYQAGDESDANVITDGTNTNYALATPVPFTWAEPLNLGVKVDENGTERAVQPAGATAPGAPFVADTTYTMSVARMVEKLQNL